MRTCHPGKQRFSCGGAAKCSFRARSPINPLSWWKLLSGSSTSPRGPRTRRIRTLQRCVDISVRVTWCCVSRTLGFWLFHRSFLTPSLLWLPSFDVGSFDACSQWRTSWRSRQRRSHTQRRPSYRHGNRSWPRDANAIPSTQGVSAKNCEILLFQEIHQCSCQPTRMRSENSSFPPVQAVTAPNTETRSVVISHIQWNNSVMFRQLFSSGAVRQAEHQGGAGVGKSGREASLPHSE